MPGYDDGHAGRRSPASAATNELYSLAQEVVDAAHDLAQLCLRTERYDDAIWAAERGLLAGPLAEILEHAVGEK